MADDLMLELVHRPSLVDRTRRQLTEIIASGIGDGPFGVWIVDDLTIRENPFANQLSAARPRHLGRLVQNLCPERLVFCSGDPEAQQIFLGSLGRHSLKQWRYLWDQVVPIIDFVLEQLLKLLLGDRLIGLSNLLGIEQSGNLVSLALEIGG